MANVGLIKEPFLSLQFASYSQQLVNTPKNVTKHYLAWVKYSKFDVVHLNESIPFNLGAILPGIFMVLASYAGCNIWLVVLCFTLAMGTMGSYYPGMRVNGLDLSPNYAGLLMSLTNGLGSIAGIVAPVFAGMMAPNVSSINFITITIFLHLIFQNVYKI